MTVTYGDLTIDWFGYATLRIETGDSFVAYLDPGRYGVLTGEWTRGYPDSTHPEPVEYDARDGDLVCVTHDHHYDSDGIERVARPDATLAVYEAVDASRISRGVRPVSDLPHEVVRPHDNDDLRVGSVEVRTVPAYNHVDGPRADAHENVSHPEGFGCGFLLDFDGTTVFWTGDTDVLDFHAGLNVDVFVPPIGGTTLTMDQREVADLAGALDPDLVVPMHYDTFERLDADSRAFAADVAKRGVPVALDET
jgi:L-ascorbate metabolism protein UlaG (beta-lactamase superfamily)